MKTQGQTIYSVGEPGVTASLEVLKEETRAWHRIYCAENSCREISARRWVQIEDELERTGTYWQSAEELEYGAKVAWRNSLQFGVPESPEILYTTALSKNPVGLYVPLLG